MGKIILRNMRFHALHGVYAEENTLGTSFLVTVTLDADLGRAAQTDCLNDTLNYQAVYAIVKREMERPSQLIEHVAGRILRAVRQEFPQVLGAEIHLRKMHPPLGGEVESSEVVLGF